MRFEYKIRYKLLYSLSFNSLIQRIMKYIDKNGSPKEDGQNKVKILSAFVNVCILKLSFIAIQIFGPNLSSLSSIQWQSHKDQKMPASSLHGSKQLQQLGTGDPAITNSGQFNTGLANKNRKLKKLMHKWDRPAACSRMNALALLNHRSRRLNPHFQQLHITNM